MTQNVKSRPMDNVDILNEKISFTKSWIGGDPISQPKDTLCDIRGSMTRSKTRRIKHALQGLIIEINFGQGELEVTQHWVTFLQAVDEDLSPS